MNREFLLNAAFLVLVNVLIKPFYVFGIERTVQERVGPEQYGLYATLFSFAFLLFMVNDFGIHYFNNRNIARHPQLVDKYFPNILVIKGLLTVLYLAFVFVAALVRGFEPAVWRLLFFVALNHVFISLVAFLRSNISGLGMYRLDSMVSTLDKLLLIGVCAVLLWGGFSDGGFRIEWFVHAQNLTWALTAVVAFFIVKMHLKAPLRFRPNWHISLVILKKSAPYALAVFLMTAYTRFDIVILEWMLSDEGGRHEAGVYAAAYRILDALNMAGYLFAGLLLPMFSTLLKDDGREGTGRGGTEGRTGHGGTERGETEGETGHGGTERRETEGETEQGGTERREIGGETEQGGTERREIGGRTEQEGMEGETEQGRMRMGGEQGRMQFAPTHQTNQTHQPHQTLSLLRLSLQLIWGGTVTVAVACFTFRTELMLWIYPENGTAYYGDVLAFIILTLVPFSGIFVYSTLLTANDSLRKMNRLFLAGIVVNLGLNLLLIPSQKAVGAGMSAFFTQSFVLAGMMMLAKKELRLPFEPRQLFKIMAFVLLVCSANWALYQLFDYGWLLKFGTAIAVGLLLAFLLRMINLKTVLGMMKK